MGHRAKLRVAVAILLLACAAAGCSRREKIWSAGVLWGDAPTRLTAAPGARNPVLSAKDVTGLDAEYVADPFLFREGGRWCLFVEVMNRQTKQGDIGVATSDDGRSWTWRGIVLDELFHLSYPCVFRADGNIYMTPETLGAGAIRLYRADEFPNRWTCVATLVKGKYADPTVFDRDGRWWMFASSNNATLHLFTAERVTGPWTEHPMSPVVTGDAHHARMAGGVIEADDGRLLRFAQDDEPVYGAAVRVLRITRLTPTEYAEGIASKVPVLEGSGRGWNASGMHTCDAHRLDDGRWITAVDGFRYADETP